MPTIQAVITVRLKDIGSFIITTIVRIIIANRVITNVFINRNHDIVSDKLTHKYCEYRYIDVKWHMVDNIGLIVF